MAHVPDSLTLLTNLQLFAPEPQGARHLLIAGGRVVWSGGDRPQLDPALGVAVRDLGGRRVIPGLIDAHVHLTGGGGEAGYETRVPPVPLTRFTLGGITTVVGLLGTDDVTRSPGELLATTRGLRALGLSAYCYTGGYHLPPVTVTGSIRGDIVHLDPMLGVGELALSDHRSSQPTFDQLLQVAAEAHVAGLMTGKAGVVHLHLGDGPRGLELVRRALDESEIPARVFHPTHVNRRRALFDEALALVSRGITIDVTAFPVGPEDDGWSAADALERYWKAGAPPDQVTVSSDGGGCLPVFDRDGRVTSMGVGDPGALAATLRELLGRGIPLERVLPPFTRNVARVLRLERKGQLAPGADADLVVLEQDGTIRDVMANGCWQVQAGRPVIRGTFEEASG